MKEITISAKVLLINKVNLICMLHKLILFACCIVAIYSIFSRCIASIEETRVINEADVEEIPEKEQATIVTKNHFGRSSVSSVCSLLIRK